MCSTISATKVQPLLACSRLNLTLPSALPHIPGMASSSYASSIRTGADASGQSSAVKNENGLLLMARWNSDTVNGRVVNQLAAQLAKGSDGREQPVLSTGRGSDEYVVAMGSGTRVLLLDPLGKGDKRNRIERVEIGGKRMGMKRALSVLEEQDGMSYGELNGSSDGALGEVLGLGEERGREELVDVLSANLQVLEGL